MPDSQDAVLMTDEEFDQALSCGCLRQIRRMITQIDNFVGKTVHDLDARRKKAVERFNSHIL